MTTAEKLTAIAENVEKVYKAGQKAEIDAFWNSFFREGRTDFSYAFVNRGDTSIVPPKVINASIASYMLMNCTGLIDGSTIRLNITNKKPNVLSLCMGCVKLTKPPDISFSEEAHVVRSYVCAFTNCVQLREAVIWLGDGTQSASGERNDMANCFLNCSELQNLTFTGQGSPKNLDLSSCSKLTYDSYVSLSTAVMDVSGETSGAYSITVATGADVVMGEDVMTAFADKGWTINVKEATE